MSGRNERESVRHVLFRLNGVGNPIKDVPTGESIQKPEASVRAETSRVALCVRVLGFETSRAQLDY